MKSLQTIIDRIVTRHQELGDKFNINQLRSIIREQTTPVEEFELTTPNFDKEKYSKKVLHKDDTLEVVLIRWESGASSLIHDHGNSYGIVRVLQGSIGFDLYDEINKVGEGLVPAIDTFDLPEGILHRMYNPSELEDAISLHFYCPKISEMFLYDPISKKQIKI